MPAVRYVCGTLYLHFSFLLTNNLVHVQALLGGLKLVAAFGESFMEDVLIGVCDISGVSTYANSAMGFDHIAPRLT